MSPDASSPPTAESSAEASARALAWGVESRDHSYWPVRGALLFAAVLYLFLPDSLIPGPRWFVPALEGIAILCVSIATPHQTSRQSPRLRVAMLSLVGLVTAANIANLGMLVHVLFIGGIQDGRELTYSAAAIWLTNVIVFGVWYFELDRGGPVARHSLPHPQPDFAFVQMTTPGLAPDDWSPGFLDYLYVSFTNATAFSPTDTLPITQMAKTLMAVQSGAALLTVLLVAGRAVNILH